MATGNVRNIIPRYSQLITAATKTGPEVCPSHQVQLVEAETAHKTFHQKQHATTNHIMQRAHTISRLHTKPRYLQTVQHQQSVTGSEQGFNTEIPHTQLRHRSPVRSPKERMVPLTNVEGPTDIICSAQLPHGFGSRYSPPLNNSLCCFTFLSRKARSSCVEHCSAPSMAKSRSMA